uniref:Uncharacterized protein n=1 Tax=Lygus hesperus TaxID=30085 RepID=A0A146LGG5_LYGHE
MPASPQLFIPLIVDYNALSKDVECAAQLAHPSTFATCQNSSLTKSNNNSVCNASFVDTIRNNLLRNALDPNRSCGAQLTHNDKSSWSDNSSNNVRLQRSVLISPTLMTSYGTEAERHDYSHTSITMPNSTVPNTQSSTLDLLAKERACKNDNVCASVATGVCREKENDEEGYRASATSNVCVQPLQSPLTSIPSSLLGSPSTSFTGHSSVNSMPSASIPLANNNAASVGRVSTSHDHALHHLRRACQQIKRHQ